MEIREAFSRAQQGDTEARKVMENLSETGSKEAETILLEEINKARLNNPDAGFKEVFTRVAEAHPLLHRAYLNSSGRI